MLTFLVPVAQRPAWLAREEQVWTGFLATCPGFVRKEVWVSDATLSGDAGDPSSRVAALAQHHQDGIEPVHAVIWWETLEQWKAITAEQVAAVDAEMGDLLIQPSMRTYQVASTHG